MQIRSFIMYDTKNSDDIHMMFIIHLRTCYQSS